MAVNQPRQEIFGQELYETIEEKAAILGINLIKKYPFQNANKRTAFMAMDVFLRLNQVKVSFKQNEAIDFVVKIATHDSEDFDQLKRSVVDTINDHMMN
ncbi:type II toxin-antitoxin system death-on-curing family toxin [Enterococcus hirae]|nr:type II toxin-antitoxin system death-on-curing family toxin [Enterococcus hirae]EMF0192426.1 type II toxin-antitoxin system death-on-curing family toxin [Enterococcus hirae]EMF0239408.1 type II toxin-antitoxin system death-on-curing family toxin [Enterococcus hirae]EMF0245477.1 type II toxin-antitoxin system death-on-curing family toxin [Enterococcus hirae]